MESPASAQSAAVIRDERTHDIFCQALPDIAKVSGKAIARTALREAMQRQKV